MKSDGATIFPEGALGCIGDSTGVKNGDDDDDDDAVAIDCGRFIVGVEGTTSVFNDCERVLVGTKGTGCCRTIGVVVVIGGVVVAAIVVDLLDGVVGVENIGGSGELALFDGVLSTKGHDAGRITVNSLEEGD